jgi:hypothetical protein
MKARILSALAIAALLGGLACASKPKPAPSTPNSETSAGAPIAPAPAAPITAPATEVAPPPASAATPAQSVPTGAEPAPVSNAYEEILRLKQANMSDQFILAKIRTDNVNYHLTTDQILSLRRAGLSEEVLEAMIKSGQAVSATAGTPTARKAEFTLALVEKSVLGVFGTSTRNVGRLTVEGDKLTWIGREPDENRSLYVQNIKQIYNTCVLRAGGNHCLEFGLITYTGDEFRLRDPGWERGENQGVVGLTEYFRTHLPNVPYAERTTEKL